MRTAPPAQQQAGGDMAEIRPFRVEVHDAAIFAASCGGAPLENIKQYIEQQKRPA